MDASVFEARAESFFRSMSDLRDLGEPNYASSIPDYRSSIALLAVHAAISFGDLLLVLATGTSTKGSHVAAPKELRKAMKSRGIECAEVSRLALRRAA